MFQRIGVPLDGSARAEKALPVAARLAQASGGTVVLLRVVNPQGDLAPYYPSSQEVVQRMIHDDQVASHHYLESLTSMSLLAAVKSETAVLCGQPATRILSEVDASQMDLIVMCSHGYGGVERQLRGSLAEEIVQGAHIPVLVLCEEGMHPLASFGLTSGSLRALVPLDGSVYAQAALAPAAQLVVALSAPAAGVLHLARVVVLPDAQGSGESERNAILREARSSLESMVKRLREDLIAAPVAELQPSLSWSITVDDDIASGICRLAENGEDAAAPGRFDGADIIAMATRGFGRMQRCGAGSLTARVLHTIRLPLLVVPPPAVEHRNHLLHDEEANPLDCESSVRSDSNAMSTL